MNLKLLYSTYSEKKIKLLNSIFILLIRGIRPPFGPTARRYVPGCTQFAIFQLQEKPLFPAVWQIFKRILSCNPFI